MGMLIEACFNDEVCCVGGVWEVIVDEDIGSRTVLFGCRCCGLFMGSIQQYQTRKYWSDNKVHQHWEKKKKERTEYTPLSW